MSSTVFEWRVRRTRDKARRAFDFAISSRDECANDGAIEAGVCDFDEFDLRRCGSRGYASRSLVQFYVLPNLRFRASDFRTRRLHENKRTDNPGNRCAYLNIR